MTSRERFLAATSHKEPDQIPLSIATGVACRLHLNFYLKLLDYLGIKDETPQIAENQTLVYSSDRVLEILGNDCRSIIPKFLPNPPGGRTTEFSEDAEYYYMTNSWGEKLRMPKGYGLYYDSCYFPMQDAESEEDDEKYEWMTPPKEDPSNLQQAIDYQNAGYPTIYNRNISLGFLHAGCHVYGFENWFMMLAGEPERAAKFNAKLLEKKMEWWGDKLDLFKDKVDVVCEGDDLGSQTAPFISEKVWKQLILPYMKELFAFIKKKSPNVRIELHSDGSFLPMIPDLIDIGLDCLNPIQYSANGMDLVKLKREFGKDLTFWGGGIDIQSTLPNGTRQQVKDEVARNIEILRKGGGYIFSATHNIQPDVPVENFMAVIEAFRENCKY